MSGFNEKGKILRTRTEKAHYAGREYIAMTNADFHIQLRVFHTAARPIQSSHRKEQNTKHRR